MVTKNPILFVPEEKGLFISRIFDAPGPLIWKAWTDPEQLKRWWGPKGYTTPFCRIDFRVGGSYLFCMRSPEGRDFWSTGSYREIIPFNRIVYTDSFADEKGNVVSATYYGMKPGFPKELGMVLTFEEYDAITKLTLTQSGIPAGEMAEMTRADWNQSFEKLAKMLE